MEGLNTQRPEEMLYRGRGLYTGSLDNGLAPDGLAKQTRWPRFRFTSDTIDFCGISIAYGTPHDPR